MSKICRWFLIAMVVLITVMQVAAVEATTLEVGKSGYPYSKIQDAINAAGKGDSVLVHDGTYVENITIGGKGITVRSENGADYTTIDGNQNGHVVIITGASKPGMVLEGFTIQNGSLFGIFCYDSFNATMITNCIITNNYGGGIWCKKTYPKITNCIITNNNDSGIYCDRLSRPEITNCTITDNTSGDGGGGIYCYHDSSPSVRNSIVWGNTGGDIFRSFECDYVRNCEYTSSIYIDYSNFRDFYIGEGKGNINITPLFVGGGDYHLQHNSPCIDIGTSSGAPDDDIEGTPRPLMTGYDIGAYEYCDSTLTWYKDADSDGYSDGTTLSQCQRPTDYYLASELTATNGDCDDENANVNPGVEESPAAANCDDYIDNNCDGNIDEGCVCIPSEEVCDGRDNDCDGEIDENFPETYDGDVNGDSNITPQDALLTFQHYLGLTTLDQCQQDHADVNNDGSITPADALCIFQKYLGLPSCLD